MHALVHGGRRGAHWGCGCTRRGHRSAFNLLRATALGGPEGEHAQQRHLEPGARIRRQCEIAATGGGDLVIELDVFRGELLGQRHEGAIVAAVFVRSVAWYQLDQLDPMQHAGQIIQYTAEIRRERRNAGAFGHQGIAATRCQCLKQTQYLASRDTAEHRAHVVHAQRAPAIGDGLVQ